MQPQEPSKFAGALGRLKRPTVEEQEQPTSSFEPPAEVAAPLEAPPAPVRMVSGGGRRAGKRSDPAYKQISVIMRKETNRLASRKLEDIGSEMDFSELVEKLVSDWLKR